MATMKEYESRASLIEQAWQDFRPVGVYWSYITDQNVDQENCSHCAYGSSEFWSCMLTCLDMSAAQRLEDMGIDWKSFPVALNY